MGNVFELILPLSILHIINYQEKCEEVLSWLDNNQTADKEEFDHKKEEVEAVCKPIITKLYQGTGGMAGGMAGDMGTGAGASSGGPTVEEVD